MLLEIFADWLDIILLFQSQQHCCFVTLHQQYTIFNKSLTSFLTFFPQGWSLHVRVQGRAQVREPGQSDRAAQTQARG